MSATHDYMGYWQRKAQRNFRHMPLQQRLSWDRSRTCPGCLGDPLNNTAWRASHRFDKWHARPEKAQRLFKRVRRITH